ncbi:MAG: STAS-like domain-containing protein [Alphaproteobacteria bacterium]|uniref:STAS-like domain-containing protein n=1 Tax=Candidatus Nitrobium versatile TaxID=2884831 RepID=A0A953JB88_9BACT|nr:STAS-like domain-containing protein [Candidatus Nitrobium versatile]
MRDTIKVSVYDIVGGPLCVSAEDGQKVYERIAPLLEQGNKVALSFAKVETLISAFLNAAVGQLYGKFTEDQVRALLTVEDMDQEDMSLLKRVVDNAKAYFKSPKEFDQAWKEEVGDEE